MPKIIKRTTNNRNIKEIFNEFQTRNKIKNLSPKTIIYYEVQTRSLFDFLRQQSISNIQDVTPDVVDNYILYLQGTRENSITVNTILRSVRAFLYFCMSKGYLSDYKIKLIKQGKKIMATYTDDDIKKLIGKKPNLKTVSFVQHRNYVMICYFMETGNRLSSALNIKVEDINFKDRYLILKKTKNRSEQIVPLTQVLISILPEYIQLWGLPDDGYLFPSQNGTQATVNAIESSIARYNKAHGVKLRSIHAMRHTFSKHYIQTGGSAFKLQMLLGHRDLAMTKNYVNLFANDISSDIDEHSICEEIRPVKKYIKRKK